MYVREGDIIDKIKMDIDNFIAVNTQTIKRMSLVKQSLRKTIYALHLEEENINATKRSFYEKMCIGEISPNEYRTQVDALTDNSDTISKIETKINDFAILREQYNFYVKINARKISIEKFIEIHVKQVLVFTKDNIIS